MAGGSGRASRLKPGPDENTKAVIRTIKIFSLDSEVEAEREKMKARINGWKVLGIVWLVAAASGIFYLWYQDNHIFGWRLSLDGIITLAGGGLAFLAVMAQISAQRNEGRDEQEREKLAVARATLFEINDFYRYFVRTVRETIQGKECKEVVRGYFPRGLEHVRFCAAEGIAQRIGVLPSELVAEIVRFYSLAQLFLDNLREWRFAVLNATQGTETRIDWSAQAAHSCTVMQHILPCLVFQTHKVCERLCELTKVPFEPLTISVADLEPGPLEEECRKSQEVETTKQVDAQAH